MLTSKTLIYTKKLESKLFSRYKCVNIDDYKTERVQ